MPSFVHLITLQQLARSFGSTAVRWAHAVGGGGKSLDFT